MLQSLRLVAAVDDDHCGLLVSLAAIGDDLCGIIGQQDVEIAVDQHILILPAVVERLIMLEETDRVFALSSRRDGAAVIGVIVAGHADLIAVIDGRSAGHGELDQRSELLALLACRHVGGVEFLVGGGFLPGRQRPEQALGVVAVEQVHQRVVGGIRIILTDRFQARGKLGGQDDASAVGKALRVEGPGRQQSEHGIAQAVVHGGVGAVAAQHAQQRAVLLPGLADDQRIGLVILHLSAEGFPIAGREGGVAHHIHAPAAAPLSSQ